MQRVSIGLAQKGQEEKNLKNILDYMMRQENGRLLDEQHKTDVLLEQIAENHSRQEESMENLYV